MLDATCQTTSDNKIILHHFYSANVDYDLSIHVRMRNTGQPITYTSRLFSSNGELEYIDNYNTVVSKVSPA